MNTSIQYSIDFIREQAKEFVQKGIFKSEQPIDAICEYIAMIHWEEVERELKLNNLVFSDSIKDLLAKKI